MYDHLFCPSYPSPTDTSPRTPRRSHLRGVRFVTAMLRSLHVVILFYTIPKKMSSTFCKEFTAILTSTVLSLCLGTADQTRFCRSFVSKNTCRVSDKAFYSKNKRESECCLSLSAVHNVCDVVTALYGNVCSAAARCRLCFACANRFVTAFLRFFGTVTLCVPALLSERGLYPQSF